MTHLTGTVAGTDLPTSAQPVPERPSRARHLAATHPVAAYLAVTFVVGWGLLLPLVLTGNPVEPGLIVLVLVGQLLPAVLISAAEGGRPAVRALFAQTFRWRVAVHWWLVAVVAVPVVAVAGAALVRGPDAVAALTRPGVVTGYLVALTIVPVINLWEETGWMFVQTRLAARHGAVRGAALTAVAFAALHLPLYVDPSLRTTLLVALAALVIAVPFRLLAGWLHGVTGGSVLLVAIYHGAFNATNSQTFGDAVAPGVEPALLGGGAVLVLGALLAVRLRRAR